jgi:Tfp pilus assembly protein PilZ
MDLKSELCDDADPNCFFPAHFFGHDQRRLINGNSIRLMQRMQDLKKRKFERTKALNLVDYIILGENGSHLSRGMGRTRNVSEGGLLLETHRPLKDGQVVLLTLSLKDDMFQLRGKIVHQEPPAAFSEGARYCAGVKFTAVDKKGIGALNKYIRALKASKRA